jgi:murein DD-endopeptidase MepM/ murein hydrolase activator NlpD
VQEIVLLNATAVARRVRDRLAGIPARGIDPFHRLRPRSSAFRATASSGPSGRRRTAVRHDRPSPFATLASVLLSLRHRIIALGSERRAVPLVALGLIVISSLFAQGPALVSAGGTGGTDGPGTAYAARIAPANIDATGMVDGPDPGATAGGVGAIDGPAGAGNGGTSAVDAGAYTLVDGSLIKPITAASTVSDISGQVRTYVVKSGDTLSGISSRFGLKLMTIWWANRLTDVSTLHIGQKLLIPPVDGVLYTVQPGDTVTLIARKFHASADQVRAYNSLTGDTVVIGQEIMVPDGRGAPIPAATPQAQTASVTSGGAGANNTSGAGANGPVGGACTSCAFAGSMQWPVPGGYISQYYWWGHPALDIAAAMGTPVLAAAAGVVTYAGWRDNGGGYQVWISHGNNIFTTYNHMSAVMVAVGQHVDRGQQVGRVGMTGTATGPHCHFEVWIGPIWDGGSRVNPLNYLSH